MECVELAPAFFVLVPVIDPLSAFRFQIDYDYEEDDKDEDEKESPPAPWGFVGQASPTGGMI